MSSNQQKELEISKNSTKLNANMNSDTCVVLPILQVGLCLSIFVIIVVVAKLSGYLQ